MSERPTEVYIVRHCEAEGNLRKLYQGMTDSDISEKGKKQLDCLSKRFSDVNIDVIYTSPLKRAKKTAEAIRGGRDIPVIEDKGIIEIDGGVLEGVPWDDMPKKYPELIHDFIYAPDKFAPEGGEAMTSAYRRAMDAVLDMVAKNRGGTIAVASHAGVIRNIICRAAGLPIEELKNVPWSDNTGVTLLRFNDDGTCETVYENDISHLPQELRPSSERRWWRDGGEEK